MIVGILHVVVVDVVLVRPRARQETHVTGRGDRRRLSVRAFLTADVRAGVRALRLDGFEMSDGDSLDDIGGNAISDEE